MHTRKDYMDGRCDHRTYYAQFVTMAVFRMVERRFTVERLVRCSDQAYFNTIPLHQWDQLVPTLERMVDRRLMKELGEGWSLSTGVCILKEASRQVVENHWTMEVA